VILTVKFHVVCKKGTQRQSKWAKLSSRLNVYEICCSYSQSYGLLRHLS